MVNSQNLIGLRFGMFIIFPFALICFVISGSQRLSDEEQRSPDVEVYVRVPLEKELPLSPIIKEETSLEEKPEFPELTEVWKLYPNVLA